MGLGTVWAPGTEHATPRSAPGRSIRESSVTFWSRFGSRGRPKNDPWSDIFAKKMQKGLPGKVREPPWSRPGRCMFRSWSQNGPKTHFYRFYDDFGPILDRFWEDFNDFSQMFVQIVSRPLSSFIHNPSTNFPKNVGPAECA